MIKYPAAARQNGISGILVLEVLVDETGQVLDIAIKKSLSADCDEEAIRAFENATQQAYSPLIIDGRAKRFKLEKSVGFWLV